MLELAGEVQDTLGRAYGLPDDIDEDDLEAGPYSSLVNKISSTDHCDGIHLFIESSKNYYTYHILLEGINFFIALYLR